MTSATITTLLAGIGRPWDQISADIHLNWYIYLSMPLIAMFVGYGTKVVAIWMLYSPIEYKGIGPIGWQGIMPRRAGKIASLTITTLTERLLDPKEMLDSVDAEQAVEQLREPLTAAVDSLARDLTEQLRPGLWDSMPERGREAIQARVRKQAPRVIDNLVNEMKEDLSLFVDLHYLAVTVLVRNKAQVNTLMKGMAGGPQQFIRRSGIWFGLVLGLIQMVAWGVFHNPWIMPAFGLFVGFASDYAALNLMFWPRTRTKLFGLIPILGVIHRDRANITANYARVMSTDIFAPEVVAEAILNGPTSDRIFMTIGNEISQAIDDQFGVTQPLVSLAIGTRRYEAFKSQVVTQILERIPSQAMALDKASSAEAAPNGVSMDFERLIVEKMSALTNDEFEAIMRPIFKDDELLMVCVGALLGFAVGELQVVLVEHLSRGVH